MCVYVARFVCVHAFSFACACVCACMWVHAGVCM